MTTLDKIKADIRQIVDEETEHDETWARGLQYSLCILDKYAEQEPCENCCNGNQIKKAKLCQKSYLAGMEHKQEPCDDAIDRAEAQTEIMMFVGNVKSDEEDVYIKVSDAVQLLRELPSVRPQEPTNPCDPCKFNTKLMLIEANVSGYAQGLKESSKTGHWKRISMDRYTTHAQYWYECDKCGEHNLGNTDFCPYCGCRMVEPRESEEHTE